MRFARANAGAGSFAIFKPSEKPTQRIMAGTTAVTTLRKIKVKVNERQLNGTGISPDLRRLGIERAEQGG
jgi:hypothetical protein